jgi:peptide chain release factor 2
MKILRAKLWELEEARRRGEIKELKGDYRPASWGNQIRSYILHPYKLVKDLRTDFETSDAEGVLDGNLQAFVEAEIKI